MSGETERRFEAVLDVFSGAAFVIDGTGRYLDVHGDGSEELLVTDPQSLEGRRFEQVLPADLAARFRDAVDRALETDSPEVIEYELAVDGGERWFEASIAPIDGDRDRVIWLARDVTERKRFERALEALHDARTRITARESVEALCAEAVDTAGSVLEFDQSIVALETDGQLVAEAMTEQLPENAVQPIDIEEGIAGWTYRTGESHLLEDSEDCEEALTDHEFRSGISVPIGEHGNFQAVAEEPGAFDQTDLELAELLIAQVEASLTRLDHERELRQRNDRLDEFASIVSHDLRNPLTVAMGHLELVREERDSADLEAIATAHDRMETLVDGLLTIAQSGTAPNDLEPVDLGRVLHECWVLIESGDATLAVDTDRTIRAHSNRLQQLLENLLRNAIEHGGADVTVTVSDHADGFYVADDGPGLPDGDPDRLFERCVSPEDGTGFGLYIVETIAESHGWTVTATDAEGGGARFEIHGLGSPDGKDSSP